MIEVNGVIYRNLEEQVQKNKDDIEDLKNQQSGDDSDIEQIDNRLTEVETTLTEITPDVMRALKTPISAPSETKIVAVDSTNSQEMLSVGTGLVIENHQLKSTGGTEIIDNLTSSSISAGLSANQGRVLDNKITTLSQTVNSKANQSSLDLTNQNVTQNTNNISTINGQISNLDSQISTNTENIEFLQSDVAGKTNVTINNVHQDYVNFSSDPQTQLNNKADKDLSNLTVNVLKYDEVYNMNSNDSNINWGYTSGIQGSVTVSGKNFSKYKKLIISVNCAYSSFSYIISLENANTLIPNDLAGYSYSGSAQSQGATVNNQVGISTAFISTDKTKIYHQSIGRYYIASTNAYQENDNSNLYCITNIMGVY